MKIEKIDLAETGYFSQSFLDYINAAEKLRPFYSASPRIEDFQKIIEARQFPYDRRTRLVEVMKEQYDHLEIGPAVSENIDSLSQPKTYTITTGHQLNIFTGPLYFIYKIITVINAAKELGKKYPDCRFVPVYWMASEDHDFEEISYFYLHDKKYTWQTNQTGAVGHFDPSELAGILDQLPGDVSLFRQAYLENKNLADAVRTYVHALFGDHGLVVVDADHRRLKEQFRNVMTADIFGAKPHELVNAQSHRLEELGFKVQVHSREINFFYLKQGLRARLEQAEGDFKVVDTDLIFSENELREEIKNHPERFSPNVILRPLYQEMILPNLAYVGGPSELVYWLQLKLMFDEYQVPFPILMPRNFGTILPKHILRTWNKTGLSTDRIFASLSDLEKEWLISHAKAESYAPEIEKITDAFEKLKAKARGIDPTLVQHLDALKTKSTGLVEKAGKKILRAEKRVNADALGQIHKVLNYLFPGGSLQERRDNFLNFYQENPRFIDQLISGFDPFDYRMHLLTDE